MKLKRVKVSGETKKRFKPTKATRVERLTIAAKTDEEAHDRQAREGRLETKKSDLQPIRERWWRRWVRGLADR